MNDLEPAIRAFLTGTAAVGGLWFILRMALSYQRDFTDRYADRVRAQEDRLTALEAEIDGLHKAREECHRENAQMKLALISAGITLPPQT